MCLITLVPSNIEIPLAGIESGTCSNPDGHGWVVASEAHGLVMGKSMNAKEAMEAFVKERERQGEASVAMFHSRLGTHGQKNLANVHPFYVPDAYATDTGEHNHFNTVVAHNGIMPNLWHPAHKDPRSDTRVFADECATWYITERGVPSRRGAKALGEIIGRGNKLVFLSTRMAGRPLVRIVNVESGTWDEGVWFSNDWFRRKRPAYQGGASRQTTPSVSRLCNEKGCKTTFYSPSKETKCFAHRVKVICGAKDCTTVVLTVGETMCPGHRVKVFCNEEGCKTEVRTKGEDKCYQHRTRPVCVEPGCTSDVLTAGEERCYQHRAKKTGWVSPYTKPEDTKPPAWKGYGIYPGDPDDEIDEETRGLLDDIDASLEKLDDVVKVSDVDPDRKCEVCRVTGAVHMPTNLCLNCKWCLDCWVHMDLCTCFDYQKWLRDRDKEVADLAAALADLDGEEAEAVRLTAEQAEEKFLAQDPIDPGEEITQEMRDFYGITDEMIEQAREARLAAEAVAEEFPATAEERAAEAKMREDLAPKKNRRGGRARATTTGPPSTNPAVKSGR